MGRVLVAEAQVNHFITEMDRLAESVWPEQPDAVEFHASEIFARRIEPWNSMSTEKAQGVIKSVLQILSDSYDSANVFACAIHKSSFPGANAVELAFEDLTRLRHVGDRQQGMMLLDQTVHETPLQEPARDLGELLRRCRHLATGVFEKNPRADSENGLSQTCHDPSIPRSE